RQAIDPTSVGTDPLLVHLAAWSRRSDAGQVCHSRRQHQDPGNEPAPVTGREKTADPSDEAASGRAGSYRTDDEGGNGDGPSVVACPLTERVDAGQHRLPSWGPVRPDRCHECRAEEHTP